MMTKWIVTFWSVCCALICLLCFLSLMTGCGLFPEPQDDRPVMKPPSLGAIGDVSPVDCVCGWQPICFPMQKDSPVGRKGLYIIGCHNEKCSGDEPFTAGHTNQVDAYNAWDSLIGGL